MSDSSQHMGASTNVRSRVAIPVRYFLILLVVIALIVPAAGYVALAQQADKPWHQIRTIYMEEYELSHPQGLAFSPDANAFLLWQEDGNAKGITMYEEPFDVHGLKVPAVDVRNIAFNGHTKKLFALGSDNRQLKEIPVDEKGLPVPESGAAQSHDLDSLNLQATRGITFDPATGRMFVLNANGDQLVVMPDPAAGPGSGAQISIFSLKELKTGSLQGIAFNPQDGHLYLANGTNQRLYELTQDGKKVSEFDLSSLELVNPKTLVFAPSVDRTDDASNMNLFLLDSGQTGLDSGQLVELSLTAPTALPSGTTLLPTTLIHVIDTSNAAWNPSAPDATGIDYWPLTGHLLMADSEVEEMPDYWQGSNVFQLTTSGTLLSTCSTLEFTREPTGLAINPNNNHIFFSDDGDDLIYEVSFGADGDYCTSDDTVTSTNVSDLYDVSDAEDVAYGNNTIFVAGGADAEVYSIPLGANGVLGGGDDGAMTHFDTDSLGFNVLEGLGYNWDNGTLLLVSPANGDKYLGEATTSGTLLRAYDLAAYTGLTHREDVTFAPGSQNPAVKNLYITDRGIDNNEDRDENDGEVYELSIGQSGPTNIAVEIGGDPVPGSPFSVAAGDSTRQSFNNINAGPAQLIGNVDILAAERVIYNVNGVGTSFSEMMGLPASQLDNVHWLPWYNNVHLDTELRIANVSGLPATVHVYIGEEEMQGSPFIMVVGESTLKSFPGINAGPVKIVSDRNIVVAERVIYKVNNVNTSFSDMIALPENQLDTTYWLPWYNNVNLDTQLRIANVTDQPATVQVTIGGVPMAPLNLAARESNRVSYPGTNDGPVKIVSNVPIVAAERVIYEIQGVNTSFSELMALPESQLGTNYWLPWYNNKYLNTQLRFANTTNSTATVHIYIGGQEMQGSPFTLPAGDSRRQSFANIHAGPVEIVSNVPIVAAERVIYEVNGVQTSFSEMMGMPANQLDNTYWFPWYNNVDFDTQLRFGVP